MSPPVVGVATEIVRVCSPDRRDCRWHIRSIRIRKDKTAYASGTSAFTEIQSLDTKTNYQRGSWKCSHLRLVHDGLKQTEERLTQVVIEIVLHIDWEVVLKHVQRVLGLFKRLCAFYSLQ